MTTPHEGLGGFGDNAASDPLPEATGLVRGASEAGYQLKILGGLGVRVLCPDFPPRLRAGQDIDLACLGKSRRKVAEHLESAGCEPDRRFNNLNGDRQMYFTAPSGRPIDVMVDRLSMCHTLDFKPSFGSPSIDPRPRRPAAFQAADRRAQRQGRARHLPPAVRAAGGPGLHPPVHRPGPVRRGARRRLGLVAHGDRQPGQAARPALLPARPGAAVPAVRRPDAGEAAARGRRDGTEGAEVED